MNSIYEEVTGLIISQLEQGVSPWQSGRLNAMPYNIISGREYSGINTLILWHKMSEGATPFWGTYQQWQQKGAQVKAGERSTKIIFYKPHKITDKETGEEKTIPLLKQYAVFHSGQVDGYESKSTIENANKVESIIAAESLTLNTGAVIELGLTPCYNTGSDKISMPEKSSFIGTITSNPTECYYATLLHELTHWTGSDKRLNRFSAVIKRHDYAFEELVAEIGAAFLCARLGITNSTRDDHASYISSWLKALNSDKKYIFEAAAAAQKAVNYLYKLQPEQEQEQEQAA